MQHTTSTPLTKRPRAAVACNPCRQTKSKCDSGRPVCERCAARNVECVYTQTVWDKRLERQDDRRVNELEAQLAAASTPGQAVDTNVYNHSRASLLKDTIGEVSEAGSQDTNPESAADILATGAFDRRTAAEIGYFGPSSNHALFRSLTAFVVKLGARDSHLYQESPVADRVIPIFSARPFEPSDSARVFRRETEGFPTTQTCIEWIARFFNTVGAVLPYISEAPLLREANRMGARTWDDSPHARSTKALLNIVFAHALSTMDDASPEPFYERAFELLMTNEQSIEIPESISPKKYPAGTATMSSSLKSSIYFSHLISLHDITGITLDSIYGSNIGSPAHMSPRDLTLKTAELLDKLEEWRGHNTHFPILTSKSDTDSWSADTIQSKAHVLLLSLYYYRNIMLISTPTLMSALEQVTNPTAGDDTSGMLKDISASVLRRDWVAIKQFQKILAAILRNSRVFLKGNAVWWVCNFTALTMCWHGLGLWLICMRSTSLPQAIGITSSEAEIFMLEGLETLKSVGGSSIMTGKAHRFLKRLMRLLKTMGLNPVEEQDLAESTDGVLPRDVVPQDNFMDFMLGSVDDIFCQLGDNDFLGGELLSMDHDYSTDLLPQ
ncbi:hypothetical protein AK830_g3642 [Neonectria ditissima]|uniref:Zn(2)-C6 fungal-type domain-containing protein n=1 Tax=Neonectria ditissima TaxID=78410 RepID=A0A0P7BNL7_9HYPO|nr:hypothetical protein AK830_g3642 [Neonectria ditissima]